MLFSPSHGCPELLKLFGNTAPQPRHGAVLGEGLALFAGRNVVPKRSFLAEYSCRIAPVRYPRLMGDWFDAVSRLGLKWGTSFDLTRFAGAAAGR